MAKFKHEREHGHEHEHEHEREHKHEREHEHENEHEHEHEHECEHEHELKICKNLQPCFEQLGLNSPLRNIQFLTKNQTKCLIFFELFQSF